jgi:hypothetical protein
VKPQDPIKRSNPGRAGTRWRRYLESTGRSGLAHVGPRALPANALGDFVKSLAHRIAKFPAAGFIAVKDRVISRPSRTFVAIRTSSARARATPRFKADSKPR